MSKVKTYRGFLLAGLLSLISLHAQDNLPKGYEIGEQSTSPDGRYAVLYPERNDQTDKYPPNLLVQLNPYKVLSKIGNGEGLPQGVTTSLLTEWSGNSTVAIWEFRKWGILDLKIYEIAKDDSVKVHDVWPAVRAIFQDDFRRRFQKKYPREAETIIFVSEEGEENPRRDFEIKGRKVLLNIMADNKPNLAGGPHWTGKLKATWNLDKSALETVKYTPGPIELRPDP